MSEFIRYSPDRVKYVIQHGFLTPLEVDRYQNYRQRNEIGVLAISPWVLHTNRKDEVLREYIYTGNMYAQRSQPTCLPWSIVNLQVITGLRPNNNILRVMLNQAIDPNSAEYGLSFEDAIRVTSSFRNRDFDFVESDLGLTPTLGMPIWRAEEESRRNAAVVRKLVAKGGLVTSVENSEYAKGIEDSHAICVAGYKTFKNGDTLVQVLDSARGRIWLTAEHFSESLDMEEVFVINPRKSKALRFFNFI